MSDSHYTFTFNINKALLATNKSFTFNVNLVNEGGSTVPECRMEAAANVVVDDSSSQPASNNGVLTSISIPNVVSLGDIGASTTADVIADDSSSQTNHDDAPPSSSSNPNVSYADDGPLYNADSPQNDRKKRRRGFQWINENSSHDEKPEVIAHKEAWLDAMMYSIESSPEEFCALPSTPDIIDFNQHATEYR